MKAEQSLSGFQRDIDCGGKLLDVGDFAFRELRERRRAHCKIFLAALFNIIRLMASD